MEIHYHKFIQTKLLFEISNLFNEQVNFRIGYSFNFGLNIKNSIKNISVMI